MKLSLSMLALIAAAVALAAPAHAKLSVVRDL
jgi:hypothetical protein